MTNWTPDSPYDEWYHFIRALDSIRSPNTNKPFNMFTKTLGRTGSPLIDANDDCQVGSLPEHPSEGDAVDFPIKRKGGTGEMYYFALALYHLTETLFAEGEFLDPEADYKDIKQLFVLGDELPILWNRDGWYIELLDVRSAEDAKNAIHPGANIVESPASTFLSTSDKDAPFASIVIGKTTIAGLNKEHKMEGYKDDYRGLMIMLISYAVDGSMSYRLTYEDTHDRAVYEMSDSWGVISVAVHPIQQYISNLFSGPGRFFALNYPYVKGPLSYLDELLQQARGPTVNVRSRGEL
jgi:hypothetical protein